jgi:predicted Zn finger-like uncharacterized protein
MIIECQSCHARFRLDASRIRGKGARVRCRRCGDSIIVLLEGRQEGVPPAPVSEGFLDLGSVVRDSLAEPPHGTVAKEPAPVPDNLIPFPAPARNPEPVASVPPSSHQEDSRWSGEAQPSRESGGGKDEVDLAFERLLTGNVEEPVAPPAEEVPRPEPEIGEGIGGTMTAAPEDVPGPAEGTDSPFLETHHHPPGGGSPSYQEERGFLLGESETLDFLKESPRQEERPAAKDSPNADISFLLTTSPVDEAAQSLRTPPPAREPGSGPEADITSRLQATSDSGPPAGMTIEGNETPLSPAPEVPVPPLREEMPPPPRAEARPSSRGEITPPRPAGSKARILGAGLAVLVLAGIGYFGFTPSGRSALQTVAPGAAAFLGGKASSSAGPAYDVRNVIGYYETGAGGRRVLVIKGQVTNLSAREKSGIRVFAAILDGTEKTLAEQAVYAGNVIPGDRLRKIDPPGAAKVLDNRFGEGLANMNVGPGKSVPFMVVFFDAPENIDSYRLEARDSE